MVACHKGVEGVVPPFRDVGGPWQEYESMSVVPHVVTEDRRGGGSAYPGPLEVVPEVLHVDRDEWAEEAPGLVDVRLGDEGDVGAHGYQLPYLRALD